MHPSSAIRAVLVHVLPLLAAAGVLAADTAVDIEERLKGASGVDRVELLLKLADAHTYRAPEKVISNAQAALDEATALELPHHAARALLLRATGLFQLGDLDRAESSYQEGLVAAEALADSLVVGGCLNGIAAVYLKRGQPDAALPFFTRAIEHLALAKNDERLAGTYSNISLIYYSKGRYDQALDHMFKALSLYESIDNAAGQGIVLNAIGSVYNKLADPARAREHFERALAIAEKTNHKQLLVGCLVNLGEILSSLEQWDAALRNLNRALAVARELGSKDYISVCLNNIGDVLREKGQPEEALRFYLESLRIFEEMNARPRLVVSYLNIGRLFGKTGKPARAEEYLIKAYALARDVDERGLQKEAAGELYALYERRGDFRRAFEYQRSFNELKEQIFSRENVEKIATLQGRIDAEKQERSIVLLRKESEIQVLEMKRQRLWLLLIGCSLAVLAAGAVVLYRRYRLKARHNAELSAAYARMAELASHDELTGLYNRRSATERIELETIRASRTHRPFGVVMIDVDDFKAINDTCGHACGDAVLQQLAGLLRASVREQDVVARWGGEEFLLVLPEASREGAVLVAEKLRQAIGELRVLHDAGAVRFTVTMGVNVYDKLAPASDCIRGADEALYRGKRSGKNTVVLAPS